MTSRIAIAATVAAAFVALGTAPAAAQALASDRLLDLRQPTVVAQSLRDAGYKAEIKTNKAGEPYIASAANGSAFSIEFYGCNGLKDCNSYQFASWYKAEKIFTPQLANEWNLKQRFLKIAVDADGDLNEWMDLTSVGKITFENFADIVDWYQVMDARLTKFLDEKRAAAKAK